MATSICLHQRRALMTVCRYFDATSGLTRVMACRRPNTIFHSLCLELLKDWGYLLEKTPSEIQLRAGTWIIRILLLSLQGLLQADLRFDSKLQRGFIKHFVLLELTLQLRDIHLDFILLFNADLLNRLFALAWHKFHLPRWSETTPRCQWHTAPYLLLSHQHASEISPEVPES